MPPRRFTPTALVVIGIMILAVTALPAENLAPHDDWYLPYMERLTKSRILLLKAYGSILSLANPSALIAMSGQSASISFASGGFGSLLLYWDGQTDIPGRKRLE